MPIAEYAALQAAYNKLQQEQQAAMARPWWGGTPWAIAYEHSRQSIDDPEFYDRQSAFRGLRHQTVYRSGHQRPAPMLSMSPPPTSPTAPGGLGHVQSLPR